MLGFVFNVFFGFGVLVFRGFGGFVLLLWGLGFRGRGLRFAI